MKRKVRPYNENYFSIPNLENSYWAGFMATDGSIGRGKYGFSLVTTFGVTDKEAVYAFCKCINYTGPKPKKYSAEYLSKIYRTVRNKYGIDKEIKSKKPIYQVQLFSNRISADLWMNFNITPRKTHNLKPPKITDEDHIEAFLCGAIDGNGCICYTNKTNLSLSFASGSKEFIFWCNEKLACIGNVEPSKIHENYNRYYGSTNYTITYSSPKAYKILSKLESIDVPKLDRKWSKVKQWREDKDLLLIN